MFRSNFGSFTYHFKQRDNRYLVARIKQHRYDNIHVYPQYGSVCDHHDFDYHSQSAGDANLYRCSAHLFGGNFDRTSHNFKQRDNRYLVACTKQYGYDDLYLYA